MKVLKGILVGCLAATFFWGIDRFLTLSWRAIEDPTQAINSLYLDNIILIGYLFIVVPGFLAGFVAGERGFLCGTVTGLVGVLIFGTLRIYFPIESGASSQFSLMAIFGLDSLNPNVGALAMESIVIPALSGAAGQLTNTNKASKNADGEAAA